MKRLFVSGVVVATTVGLISVAPPVLAVDADQPLTSAFVSVTRAPVVSSVNDRWVARLSFGPLTQLREAIAESFSRGGADVILVPQLLRRQIKVGKWVGDSCTEQTRPGPRTWQFVGSWGSDLENRGNWESIRRDQPIQIRTPDNPSGSAFAAGDVICVTQSLTWKAGVPRFPVTITSDSLPGVAPNPLSDIYVSGQTYENSMPAPAASVINSLQQFTATFGPLTQTRNSLIRKGYENPTIVNRQIRIGRLEDGRCASLTPAGGALGGNVEFVGSWARDFQNSTAWNKAASGVVRLRTSGQGPSYSVGETPCVYQRVIWTDARLPGRVTFDSAFVGTPNTIPPLDFQIDAPPLLPDGSEIVLPDFGDFDADEEDSPTDDLRIRFSLDDIRNGLLVDYINGQLGIIGTLIEAASSGGSNAQRQAAEAVSSSRLTLEGAARTVAESAASGALPEADATQLLGQLNSQAQQLQSVANRAPVRIAGGVVTQNQLAEAVGFNAFQSPIAGLDGAGVVGGLSMNVAAPKQANRGKSVSIRVKVRPSSARGGVRVALVTKAGKVIKTIGAKRVPLKKGQATTRIAVPRAASRGPYSVVASFVPTSRGQSGLTVIKPIRVK
jgi:hypothetical protein